MSLKRHAAKRDAIEAAIVEALERCGASVVRLSERGCPDLLVGHRRFRAPYVDGCREMVLLEVKRTKGKLTPDQVRWRERWRGPAPITVRSVDEALQAIAEGKDDISTANIWEPCRKVQLGRVKA